MSASSAPTLAYVPNDAPPLHLTYDATDTTCRLTFPLPPAWIGWTNIAFSLVCVAMQLVMIWIFVQLATWTPSLSASLPPGLPPIPVTSTLPILPLLKYVLYALIWTAIAVLEYMSLRRQRRVRKFLESSPGGIVCQRPTLFRSYRHWPAAEVLGVDVKTIRSLIPRHQVAELVVKVRPGRSWRIRFTGPDKIALAERFAARTKQILVSANPLPLGPNLG